MTPDVGLL